MPQLSKVYSALLTQTIVQVKTTQDQGQKVNMRYSKQHTIQVYVFLQAKNQYG